MHKDNNEYHPKQDYCDRAAKSQSVPSAQETYDKLVENGTYPTNKAIKAKREGTMYPCNDDYSMGTIQDGKIYIATTDAQHQQIANGQPVTADGGLSGYFSDQATVNSCKVGGAVDNTAYNQKTQIAPFRKGGLEGAGDASYKPHLDCFEIDKAKLKEKYHTTDFNAALAKCMANNQKVHQI